MNLRAYASRSYVIGKLSDKREAFLIPAALRTHVLLRTWQV